MPGAPLAKGIIITVSVLVAAGIAAYESNPQVREWIDRSTNKVAMAFRSLSDDFNPRRPRPRRSDPSMREDADEKAEERRRQARAEIMERGRIMEERRKRRKTSTGGDRRPSSFDTLVDENGVLLADIDAQATGGQASTSALETQERNGTLRPRHGEPPENPMLQSVDAPMLLRQLNTEGQPAPAVRGFEPWESQYEQEMRHAWNLPLAVPGRGAVAVSSHASESLIDLTTTAEEFPDPDVSIPSTEDLRHPLDRTEYFSAAASTASHTMSESEPEYYYAHPSQPLRPVEPRPYVEREQIDMPTSSAASVADSTSHIHMSEAESGDDMFSDIGDGIRTPASAWTEVGSTTSDA